MRQGQGTAIVLVSILYSLQSALQWDSMHHREKVEVRKYVKHFQWEKVYWEISKQEMNCALLSIMQPSSDRFNIYTVDTKCCSLHCMSWLVFSVNLFLVWGGRHPLAVLQGIFLSKKLIGLMSFTVIVPYLSRERGALWSILTLYNYSKLKYLHYRLYPLCYAVYRNVLQSLLTLFASPSTFIGGCSLCLFLYRVKTSNFLLQNLEKSNKNNFAFH